MLAIASQQLQLAGNVRAALLALQLAEARLARADRPQFVPMRRALARDIERLKALPAVDVPAMTARLDSLVAGGRLAAARLRRAQRAAGRGEGSAPARRARLLVAPRRRGVGRAAQLVVVRQVGPPEPPLLPPPQAYFVRENLRLRLLNARLSLLARDEAGYREDLRAAQAWIQRYFDARSQAGGRRAGAAEAALRRPRSASRCRPSRDSLDAVRGFKSRRERERPG